MLILLKSFGNHSNRLFQHIHFEAFCSHNKIRFYNPTFQDMRQFYHVAQVQFFDLIVLFISRLLLRLKLIHIVSVDEMGSEEFKIFIMKNSLVFCEGWSFRASDLTELYKRKIATKFRPKKLFYEAIGLHVRLLENKKERINTTIGVHVRRGDYRFWENGKYYFEDAVYLRNIECMKLLLENTDVDILIFGSEPQPLQIAESENLHFSRNEWYIDHLLMGLCDYLIGPPSTFTLWASYSGNAKYYHIKSSDDTIKSLKEFSVCNG